MNEYNQNWVLLEDGITWSNEYHKLHAYIKWDGCTHLWFEEQTEEDTLGCYHHICDIDDFLEAMQALREKAAQKFDQEIEVMSEEERKGLILPFHRYSKSKSTPNEG